MQDKREENRKKMPEVARFVDLVREVFGDVKVIEAEENGIKLGGKNEQASTTRNHHANGEKG